MFVVLLFLLLSPLFFFYVRVLTSSLSPSSSFFFLCLGFSGETPEVVKAKEDTAATATGVSDLERRPGVESTVPRKEDAPGKVILKTKVHDPSAPSGQSSSGKDVLTSPSTKGRRGA